jgi:hypothetical protein
MSIQECERRVRVKYNHQRLSQIKRRVPEDPPYVLLLLCALCGLRGFFFVIRQSLIPNP